MSHILRFHAMGADEVEQTWRRYVPSARLERADRRPVRFDWSSIEIEGLTIVDYSLSASVRSEVAPIDQFFACRVTGEDVWVGTNTSTIDARQPWASTGDPIRARWTTSARVSAFVFDRDAAERTARQVTGHDGLDLRVLEPTASRTDASRVWEWTVRHVTASISSLREEAPLIEAELARHALLSTLAVFPTTFSDLQRRSAQRSAAPTTVRRALSFIESHAADPITVDDIAAAAGISTRGLQSAFRRALDTTPGEHLRRVRLAAAARDLASGTASSVGEVARRWGFPHTSRFAQYFRQQHGRYPSEVFRRG